MAERKDIKTLPELVIYARDNDLNSSEVFSLTRQLGESESVIRGAIDAAQNMPKITDPYQDRFMREAKAVTPPPTLQQAKNLLNNPKDVEKVIAMQVLKENPPVGVDVRSLEEKETEYIKNYVETGVLGPVDFKQDTDLLIPGAAGMVAGQEPGETVDTRGQVEEETKYIESVVNNITGNVGSPTGGEVPGGEVPGGEVPLVGGQSQEQVLSNEKKPI